MLGLLLYIEELTFINLQKKEIRGLKSIKISLDIPSTYKMYLSLLPESIKKGEYCKGLKGNQYKKICGSSAWKSYFSSLFGLITYRKWRQYITN